MSCIGNKMSLTVKGWAAMEQVFLKNYRCFRDEQSARLAPLTLLVGENSTGKTSFMALVRALLGLTNDVPIDLSRVSIFNSPPYDLGSFDEVVHYRGPSTRQVKTFQAGYVSPVLLGARVSDDTDRIRVEYTFGKNETGPTPTRMRLSTADAWVQLSLLPKRSATLSFGTPNGSWKLKGEHRVLKHPAHVRHVHGFFFVFSWLEAFIESTEEAFKRNFVPPDGSHQPTQEDRDALDCILGMARRFAYSPSQGVASAPVRSKPQRTYDPSPYVRDPEGTYVAMYLANMSFSNPDHWQNLKRNLERFGKSSGLFDELAVRHFGKKDTEPFQVQVRQFGSRLKGPQRNLIDVGYGVSQVLAVVTDLIGQDIGSVFLLQQPEVHLHPSAQAALGSFFCQIASSNHQLVVETHSDHILDRVRMDVRDQVCLLNPKDVSILYFERNELDVRIHSLRLDEDGNILDAPDSYRNFFMKETKRSLGL